MKKIINTLLLTLLLTTTVYNTEYLASDNEYAIMLTSDSDKDVNIVVKH